MVRQEQTMRKRVFWLLLDFRPHKLTAKKMAVALNVRLDSLSSLLVRMVDKGQIQRRPGYGPRGGNGYFIRDYR